MESEELCSLCRMDNEPTIRHELRLTIIEPIEKRGQTVVTYNKAIIRLLTNFINDRQEELK